MRKIAITSLVVLATSFSLFAQSSSDKLEVFGGYSYVRFNPGQGASAINQNGWDSTATFKLTPMFGISADVDGSYNSQSGVNNHIYTYMFGPEVKMNKQKSAPFVHALFGFAHDNVSSNILGTNVSVTDNAFATALGGGYDWKASDAVSVRLFQVDYLMTRFGSATQNNIRMSFGITFRPKFGRGF
ncbi:MAG: outer membrane beta-barrel protein [Acidobacteria bacterium]|nr:outer membrane beta-barrel protein [Acidobacteriota bacterium]MBV9435650.1 outer membrane beta-barrel protein [Acidobacteriota bacterium]